MIPLTTEQYDWGFVSGRIAALEGRLLSRDYFQNLLGHARREDILRQLQDTPWGAELGPGSAFDDCGALLDHHLYAMVHSLRHDSPDPAPFNLFLVQGDYLNLKHALAGEKDHPFLPGFLAPEDLARVAAGDESPLPADLRARLAQLDPDLPMAERRALLDVILDGAYLRHMLELSRAIDVPLIREYVETTVLSRAIVALWRAMRAGQDMRVYRRRFLPIDPFTPVLETIIDRHDPTLWREAVGGKLADYLDEAAQLPEDEQAPHFEQRVAEHLIRLADRGRYQTFGPERAFSFLVTLATEAYNLKLTVCGRLNRIDPDLLRQRLREAYA